MFGAPTISHFPRSVLDFRAPLSRRARLCGVSDGPPMAGWLWLARPVGMATGGELATKTFTDENLHLGVRKPSPQESVMAGTVTRLKNAARGVVLSGVADGHRSNEIAALQSKKQLGLRCIR